MYKRIWQHLLWRVWQQKLRDEFLTPAIAGEYVASIAVSEVHAGSDVAAIKTTAKKDGDDYVINGSKCGLPTPCRLISFVF